MHRHTWTRRAVGLLLALCCLGVGPRLARAEGPALATCVSVEAKPEIAEELRRLIETEVDRHPTHHAQREACQAYLSVELLDLGQEGRWLTGRINHQVPHREPVQPERLTLAVERLVSVLLHNDPLRLRGPRERNWLEQSLEDLRQRSTLHFGLEVLQMGLVLDQRPQTLPGVALAARREVDAFHVGLKMAGAHRLGTRDAQLRLTSLLEVSLDLTLYLSPIEDTSLFGAVSAGILHQRFHGPGSDGVLTVASDSGAVVGLRGGVELLRTSDIRLTLFAQLSLPAFKSRDADSRVVDAWVPWASLGMGVVY